MSLARTSLTALSTALLLHATADQIAAQQVHRVPAQYATIQDAIDAAQHGDVVLIADGVYRGPGNRDINFSGKDITVRSKNGASHVVIDCEGSFNDPYRGFLFENQESRNAVLEGITITGASTLEGAIADPFNGGAVFIDNSSPTIRNCHFYRNQGGCWGGAVYAGHGGAPLIENCLFEENFADDDGGGLFCWNGSAPVVRNSAFVRNSAATAGGAIASFGGSGTLRLRNITVVENSAAFGSGVYGWQTDLRNVVIWGNTGSLEQLAVTATTIVAYANIEDGYAGTGASHIMSRDPRFKKDGYRLRIDSPCIDRGDPFMAPDAGETDIDGQPREFGGRMDLGADEIHLGKERPKFHQP